MGIEGTVGRCLRSRWYGIVVKMVDLRNQILNVVGCLLRYIYSGRNKWATAAD